jgi:nucleoside 2-deoxyribosyltransferase
MSKMLYDVYLAGPFFTSTQKANMAKAKAILQSEGFRVCDPQDLSPVIVDLPPESRTDTLFEEIFSRNIQAMDESEWMVACIDDRDVGTAFEIGYFFANNHFNKLFTFSAAGYGTNVMLAQATGGHSPNIEGIRELIAPAIKSGATLRKARSDQ